MLKTNLKFIRIISLLLCVFVPGSSWAMLEYYVTTEVGGPVYQIPVGEEGTDEFGNNIYQLVDIGDFYVKQNGVTIYPDTEIAAKLYAASRSLSHLLSYSYIDASDEVSTASYNAQIAVNDLSAEQKQELWAAAGASFVGGTVASWTIAGAICVGTVGTGCVVGVITGVTGMALSAASAVGTAYTETKTTYENIATAQNIYSAGRAYMNQGFIISTQTVEPFVNQVNSAQAPFAVSDISVMYRMLGKVVAYYSITLDKFYETGALDFKPMAKRVAGAFGVGAIPAGSLLYGIGDAILNGDSREEMESKIISEISQEEQRIKSVDIFAELKQAEYQTYFETNWGVPEPVLPDVSISLSVEERSDPGKMRFTVNHLGNILVRDLYSYRYDFGDGKGLISEKGPDVSVPTPLLDYTFNENGNYTATVQFTAMDGRTSSATATFTVTHAPVDVEYAPHASRVYPDYSTDHVVDDEVRFQVRGFDVDSNLSHVIWTFDGPLELLQSDNRDDFESDEGREGYETVTARITGDNNGEHFSLFATVYDDLGNQSEPERWSLEARQSFGPQISDVTPDPTQPVEVDLAEEQTFRLVVSDPDDNSGDVIFYLDDVEVKRDGVSHGDPPTAATYDFRVYERNTHVLKAVVTDDDGQENSVEWNIIAGTLLNGNLPPSIDSFWLDSSEHPYTVFRVGKGYEFDIRASDVDANLMLTAFYINDELVDEDRRNSGTDSDHLSIMVAFPSAGTYELKAIAEDQSSAVTEEIITITVLEADGTEGTAPQFTAVYPSASTIYSPAGESIILGGTFYDEDWDADHIEVHINGTQIPGYSGHQNIYGESSFDFYVQSGDLPASGTHELKIIPVDAGGKAGNPKAWTLSIAQGNHAPTIKRAIPDTNEPIYVLADGSNSPRLFVFTEDVDGDLDEVVFDWSDVGDPDPTDSGSLSSHHFDVTSGTVHPTRSGTVTATVYDEDEDGRNSSVTFEIIVVSQLQDHAPQILHCNIDAGSHTERTTPNYKYDISVELDAYDPDGDLVSVELFQDGVLLKSVTGINDYEYDESFESNAREQNFDDLEGPDTQTRGQTAEFLLRLTDSKGNVTERNWSVTQGPTGEDNHAPTVPDNISINVRQFNSVMFTVDVLDEEGDIPTSMFLGVPERHIIEKLSYNRFNYIPEPTFSGDLDFTIMWNDGYGGTASTQVHASVEPVNIPDINNDGMVNLDDLIIVLQIVTGRSVSGVNTEGDINDDGALGVAEAINILQLLAN